MITRTSQGARVLLLGMLFLPAAAPAGAEGDLLQPAVVVSTSAPPAGSDLSVEPASLAPAELEALAPAAPDAALPSHADVDALFDDADDAELYGPEAYDPFESGNRAVFRFNQAVGRWVWNPVTRGYRFAVPGAVRRAVRRAFVNLNTPIYLVNHLLQLRFRDAAETLGAFAMNSVFGFAGLLDTSSGIGLALKPADFGQTLALVGVGSGPYLVFPVVGPTTARDGVGFVIDRAFHPLTYVLAIPAQLAGYGGAGIARRDEAHEALKALESTLDPYAVVRSAYTQAREHSIESIREEDVGEQLSVAAP